MARRSILVESEAFQAPDLDWETWSFAESQEPLGFGGPQWSARPKPE
jgi:hypothetical protein